MAAKGLKQRIRDGEVVNGLGVEMDIERSELEGYLEQREYHYLNVDCQHVAFSEDRLVSFCEMAQDLGIDVRLRIKHTQHAYLVGNYLDLGPSGIMVPEVETEAIVDEVIRRFYYPQKGKRSWGGTGRVGLKERPDRLEYAEWWNETGTLTLQVESVDAVVNARQLAKPGVDVLAFGVNDLMFSIEGHPHFPIRTYAGCVKHVLEQLEWTGVRVSVRTDSEPERDQFLELGVTVMLDRTDL